MLLAFYLLLSEKSKTDMFSLYALLKRGLRNYGLPKVEIYFMLELPWTWKICFTEIAPSSKVILPTNTYKKKCKKNKLPLAWPPTHAGDEDHPDSLLPPQKAWHTKYWENELQHNAAPTGILHTLGELPFQKELLHPTHFLVYNYCLIFVATNVNFH